MLLKKLVKIGGYVLLTDCIYTLLTHNREYWNAVSSVVCLSSVPNNFYQFGLLDFNHIQVSKAYNFC